MSTKGYAQLILTFAAMIFASQSSVAGDTLHLQGGDVQLKDLATQKLVKSTRTVFKTTAGNALAVPTTQEASKYFIVQFEKAITPQDELALHNSRLEILRYVPDDAYIVRGSSEQIEQTKKSTANLKGYVLYQPQVRLSPELKVRSVFNGDVLQTVKLQLFKGVDADLVAAKLQQQGVIIVSVTDSVLVVRAKTKILDQVAAQEGVEWVAKKAQMQLRSYVFPKATLADLATASPDGSTTATPNLNEMTGYETGTKVMGFEKAWAAGFKGRGQIVAIADTGLDTGDKSTIAKDFSHLKDTFVLGLSSKTWADYVGHGSHVAGSVGGSGEQSSKLIVGGANEALIIAQSLWSEKYKSLTTPEDLGVIFGQAYDSGARIHSNSWGDPDARGVYNAETMQVDQFVWDHPDMLILVASGNDGVDADKDGRVDPGAVSSPSTAKNIISVGASENLVNVGGVQRKLGDIEFAPGEKPWPVEPLASDTFSNNTKGIVGFSSRGPTQDGRLKPDLVAPGSNILSNCSKMPGSEELWGRYNENYCWSGGTSMATPLTAGAAALVRERLMRIQSLASPSAALVKAVLLHTAEDLYPGQYGEVGEAKGQELLKRGPNFDQGYGLVNVGSAVGSRLSLVDNKEGLATGEGKYYDTQKAIHKVTLVYNDAPGGPAVAKVLVNNLDLEVEVGGKSFKSESLIDNTEQVVLSDSSQGNVRIYVRGKSVPMGKNGKQPYALVFSE